MMIIKKSSHDRKNKKRMRKEYIKRAMNKEIFFTLTKCSKKLHGITNRYCYKSNMHGLIYKDATFQNVRYKTSIITNCNFKNANLLGVDFCNCNLKKSSFKNACLENVCFINCNLSDVDFSNVKLKNVVFVCSCLKKSKNLPPDTNYRIYNTYPSFSLDKTIINQILKLSDYPDIYIPHVLHVSKNKVNFWSLKILQDLYGDNVFRAIIAIENRRNKKNFNTIYSYIKYIESYLKL